ncbi:MAG: methyltransferase domain-containing protein [archaeon]
MKRTLKVLLKESGKFSEEELKLVSKSFDIVGSIAIIQIPKELERKKKLIAKAIFEQNKTIKSVYSKGKFYGRLRKQKISWIAGEKNQETIHKENGCRMKLDVQTCYFSPRLSTDRLEIANKVKKGEKVLVMFGGVAPYAIVIAKNSKAKEVVSIELNRECTKYAKENVKLNKLGNIKIIQGDVKKNLPKEKYDRIVMARPQLEYDFLKEAYSVSKKGGIIHFYDFLEQKDIPDKALKKIKGKVLKWKYVREIGVRKYQIRVDFINKGK